MTTPSHGRTNMAENEDKSTGMTRRERERELHRQEILDAAEEIFSVKGLAGSTIEDVAKKADFAVGSIYNFFGGKEDLIHQVFMRLVKSRIAEIEEAVIPIMDRPVVALRVLTELWISHHARHGAFLRMAFVSWMAEGKCQGGPREDSEMRRQMEIYEATGSRFFEAGIKAGAFHEIDPAHLMLIFEGICRSFLFSWKRKHDPRPETELTDELFNAVHAAITGKLPDRKAE